MVSILSKSVSYIDKFVPNKSTIRRICRLSSVNNSDTLNITSLTNSKNPDEYICDGVGELARQVKRYMKLFGVNFWDILRGNSFHQVEVIPSGIFDSPILSVERFASVPVKTRDKKVVDAVIDKIDLGSLCQNSHSYYFVLKNKGKQLGYIDVVYESDKSVNIQFLTNLLGRNKYRGTEKILVQAVVEDCLQKGFIPAFSAYAENVANFMGRGYNNKALYTKMGMAVDNESSIVSISSSKVADLLQKYFKFNGEILSGSAKRLEKIKH